MYYSPLIIVSMPVEFSLMNQERKWNWSIHECRWILSLKQVLFWSEIVASIPEFYVLWCLWKVMTLMELDHVPVMLVLIFGETFGFHQYAGIIISSNSVFSLTNACYIYLLRDSFRYTVATYIFMLYNV